MRLTLTLIRCPDSVAPEHRVVTGGEYRIGRALDNDWVLPDPPNLLSRHHCVVAFHGGAWHVSDRSANGTFLNHEPTPIGSRERPLRAGDRLVLGAYEIEVGLEEEERDDRYSWGHGTSTPSNAAHDDGPFATTPSRRSDLSGGSGSNLAGNHGRFEDDFGIFEDEFPSGPGGRFPSNEPTEPGFPRPAADHDRTPAHEGAFRPPSPVVSLPPDWDAPEAAPLPARPVTAAPPPRPSQPPLPQRTPTPSDDLLAAFLRGAGVEGTRIDDPARMMESAGEVMRALVVGLRQALIARLSIKGEFRIEQTMIRASGNNPLKFSADDDDALASLLGAGRRGGMPPAASVAEALRDIQDHELATLAAMQEAVRALVARLDPATLERQAGQAGFQAAFGKLLNPAKVRAWDAFVALHAEMSDALSDDFDSVFGKAFARAYEQALNEMAEQDRRR